MHLDSNKEKKRPKKTTPNQQKTQLNPNQPSLWTIVEPEYLWELSYCFIARPNEYESICDTANKFTFISMIDLRSLTSIILLCPFQLRAFYDWIYVNVKSVSREVWSVQHCPLVNLELLLKNIHYWILFYGQMFKMGFVIVSLRSFTVHDWFEI